MYLVSQREIWFNLALNSFHKPTFKQFVAGLKYGRDYGTVVHVDNAIFMKKVHCYILDECALLLKIERQNNKILLHINNKKI